jgi:hypothetical protein
LKKFNSFLAVQSIISTFSNVGEIGKEERKEANGIKTLSINLITN